MNLKTSAVRKHSRKTGDRIKRLLDPLILPTVDQFPLLTCGLLIAFHVVIILFAGQALHAVWPAGSEGTFLQPLYQGVKALPGTSSPLFFFMPFVATHVITCAIYLFLDWWRPAWVQEIMAHNRQAGDWGGQELGLARTLWSQLGVAPVTVLIVSYMLARNGPVPYTRPWVESCFSDCVWQLPANAPSVLELFVHLAFCLIISDAAYGYVHLQLHRHRALWKHIHSIHHEYKETFVTVGPHVHVMEFLTVFTFALFSPAACGAHPFTCWVWYSFYTLISLEAHTGWRQTPVGWFMNLITIGNFGGSMHHHLHHAIVWGNYAPFLSWLDKVIGTEILLEDEVREPEFSTRDSSQVKSTNVAPTQSEAAREDTLVKDLREESELVKDSKDFNSAVVSCEASEAMKTMKAKKLRHRAATPPPKPEAFSEQTWDRRSNLYSLGNL